MKTQEQMDAMIDDIRTVLDRIVTLQEKLGPLHPAYAFSELTYHTLQNTLAGVAWASGRVDKEGEPSNGYLTVEKFLANTEEFIAKAYSNCPG